MTIWSEAPQSVITIAQELIAKYHPELQSCNIGFLFRDTNGKSRGKPVMSHSQKVPASLKPYLDYDFIVWVSEEAWKELLTGQQTALIDHELCHCTTDGDDVPTLRGHDVEEFREIIERHGYWNNSLVWLGEMANTEEARQMLLDGIAEVKRGRVDAVRPEAGVMIE